MKKFLVTFSLVLTGCTVWAAGLKTVRSDKSSQLYELAVVQRIEFDQQDGDAAMRVKFKDGNPDDTDVKVVIFTEEGPNEVKQWMGSDVRYFLYPNPVRNELTVTGPEAGDALLVYDLAGRKQMEVKAAEGETILPVSGLEPGTYLLRTEKTVLRFVKQ
ncbi:MAG: T9SS type A sorting domain-containing protein [Paludibacteraceae bacterium]|nr:T9SS type A sorting domain-containing protein [Paludibacteraceae bacterium]